MIKYTIFHKDNNRKNLNPKINKMKCLLDFESSVVRTVSYDDMAYEDFIYLFSVLPSPAACYLNIVDAEDRLRALNNIKFMDLCKYLSGEKSLENANISKHRKNQLGYLCDFSVWGPYIVVKEEKNHRVYYMPNRKKFNSRFVFSNKKDHFSELYPIDYRKKLDIEGAIKGYEITDEMETEEYGIY